MKKILILTGVLFLFLQGFAQPYLQSRAVDVSKDFEDFSNTYFFADSLSSFDPSTASGTISWKRHSLYARQAFNTTTVLPQPLDMLDFPETQYESNPRLQFKIHFISSQTVRLRVYTSPVIFPEEESLMLCGIPPSDETWKYSYEEGSHIYKGQS
ncbi:MAG: alpha-xylosidase, partial [Bacteroidales bacterium]|nr:alpha-xylosidase [Bacteroidales bacterium]